MAKKKNRDIRVTCLNCIDGRVQLPVLHWIHRRYPVDFVDVVTAAGLDAVLSSQDNIDDIIHSIKISVDVNKSSRIFIIGHHDRRGNPVDEKTHRAQIAKSVKRLKTYWPKLEITGLWVNSRWRVEVCKG